MLIFNMHFCLGMIRDTFSPLLTSVISRPSMKIL